jgi:hypothetical protein
MRICAALITAAIGILFADRAQAADYTIAGNVSHAYSTSAGNPEVALPNYQSQVGVPLIYQVDLYIKASGFNAGADQRGFGNVTIDIARTAGLGNSSFPGWQPNGATYDHDGSGITAPVALWAVNSDTGAADLQNIIASLAVIPPPVNGADPRPNVGQYPGLDPRNLIGSVFINWSGTGVETLTLIPEMPSFAHASTGDLELDPSATLHNGVLIFGVPEPSTALLAVFSLTGLIAMARRRMRKPSI